MDIAGWKYYNHAAIPTTAPHKEPDLSPVEDGRIWTIGKKRAPLLARWTTDFDVEQETNWWYVIKDTPFDIAALKAKRRYEINKGRKHFEVKEIDPTLHKEELYEIMAAAWATYPVASRPTLVRASFISRVETWEYYKVYGAFLKENGKLCAYAILKRDDRYVDFSTLKAMPAFEPLAVNAAMIDKILEDHRSFLEAGGYICDGARSITHETAFQAYLEKYFGFRKAYCRLWVAYNPKIRWLIKWLYPLRKLLRKGDHIGNMHQLNAVLKMEELVREYSAEK